MFKPLVLVQAFACILAQIPQDVIKTGQTQYQLLQERSNLPQYGSCWKQALQSVNEGCNTLSEETQSDMALQLANCFLEMSGHETYHCEADKKPNLRKICLSNMSDRAFNVYTEFYTHTQNICWFLKGQVWQEVIAESTYQVGKQLEKSAQNQEELLGAQKESLTIQERLLKHGKDLQHIVETIVSSVTYSQETILGLQSWLISEMSWFDTALFYFVSLIFVLVFTSLRSTNSCRLPLLIMLFAGILSERFVCKLCLTFNPESGADSSHLLLMRLIWFMRYTLVALCVVTVIISICNYKDYEKMNNRLLERLHLQNLELIELLQNKAPEMKSQNIVIEYEKLDKTISSPGHKFNLFTNGTSDLPVKTPPTPQKISHNIVNNENVSAVNGINTSQKDSETFQGKIGKFPELLTPKKYNLRSREKSPDLSI